MPLIGDIFVSEILKKSVFDRKGEIAGKIRDIIVVRGDPFPKVSSLIVEKGGTSSVIPWNSVNLFNKKIISAAIDVKTSTPYSFDDEDLLAVRDILDKQIIDANGAKVVRVNDIKLEGYESEAVLTAIDVGMRGILRRLGVERGSEKIVSLFKSDLPANLISWNYLQPLRPKLQAITLTVPRQMVAELHPADLAEIINQVTREEGTHLFKDLDIETAAEALSELKPERQTDIIYSMDTEKAADIIEEMPPDEAADVLSDLPAEKAKEILEHIEKDEAEDIQELLGHEDDSAGGIMTNDFIAYRPDIMISELIERFRKDAEEIDTTYYVYAVDEEERLVGVASLREILLADQSALFEDIMETKVKTVGPDEDESYVAEMISKYNIVALPVVDDDGVLLGVITFDDIIDRVLPPSAKRPGRRL